MKAESYDEIGKRNLISYILRPPFSQDRLKLDDQGNVILALRRPFSDGTYAIKFTPDQFIERLISLVPPPGLNLVRYYGLLANRCSNRELLVELILKARKERLEGPLAVAIPTNLIAGVPNTSDSVHTDDSIEVDPVFTLPPLAVKKRYRPWAELLKKVFAIDISICSKCGSKVKILAAITQAAGILKILKHLNLPTSPPQFKNPDYFQYELF